MSLQDFAAWLERELRARIAEEYPSLLAKDGTDRYHVRVTPGPKYTRVDFEGSGKYMVVNATGEIYGIKGYGVIHRGHAFGPLATVAEWDWSGYRATRRRADQ